VRVLGVHPSSFTIRRVFPPQDTTAVAYPALVSLWRKDGSHAWYGAGIGGVLLGLAGAQLGMLACSDTGVDTSGCERSGAIGGALAGVALGALLGASYPRWQLLYDRPPMSVR
jgi:hypothetical protein